MNQNDPPSKDNPRARCSAWFGDGGVWFFGSFKEWGARYTEAAEHCAKAYRELPESLRPRWLLLVEQDTVKSRMLYDALAERGLPVVRLFQGFRFGNDDESRVVADGIAHLLRRMSDLHNLIPSGLRVEWLENTSVNKVSLVEGRERRLTTTGSEPGKDDPGVGSSALLGGNSEIKD